MGFDRQRRMLAACGLVRCCSLRPPGRRSFHRKLLYRPVPSRVRIPLVFHHNKKRTPEGVLFLFWRRRWDSNPRGLAPKRFSRPPRYDHFDTSPCASDYNRIVKRFQIVKCSQIRLHHRAFFLRICDTVHPLCQAAQRSQGMFCCRSAS